MRRPTALALLPTALLIAACGALPGSTPTQPTAEPAQARARPRAAAPTTAPSQPASSSAPSLPASSSAPTPSSQPARSKAPTSVPAAAPLAGSTQDIHLIKHIVVIMQENRSFDHYFGTYPGADGIPMQNGEPTVCANDPQTRQCIKPYHDAEDVNS